MASETKLKEDGTILIPESMDTNVNCKPWPVVEVQEVCDLIVDCVNKTAPTVDYITPYKMIRTTNIKSGKIDLTTCRCVEADTYKRWTRRAKVKAGDVLLTREAPIGEVGYVSCDDTTFLGQRIMQYRANPKVLDSRYLHYSFLSPALRYQFGVHEGSGSVVSHIRVGDCYKFKIPLPPLTEQTAIANILGTLDDKIDLNNQMNKTLEQIAQTLFKHWFIDFEFPDENGNPYKSSGGRMEDSELGKIPEGWKVKQIGDICETFGGGTPKTSESSYWEGGDVFWATPTDMTSLKSPVIFDTSRKITAKGLQNSSAKLLPAGSILMTSRATLGYFAISKVPISTNQGFISMVCDDRVSNYYLLNTVQNKMDEIENLAGGSTFLEINKTSFRSIKIILPPKSIMKKFDEIADLIYEKIFQNELETKRLAEVRDSLLPKLMSGKIRVEC